MVMAPSYPDDGIEIQTPCKSNLLFDGLDSATTVFGIKDEKISAALLDDGRKPWCHELECHHAEACFTGFEFFQISVFHKSNHVPGLGLGTVLFEFLPKNEFLYDVTVDRVFRDDSVFDGKD